MKISELIELLDARVTGGVFNPETMVSEALARQNFITIIETPYSVFNTSGLLYQHGIKPLF